MKQLAIILILFSLLQGCSYQSYETTIIDKKESDYNSDNFKELTLCVHSYYEEYLPLDIMINREQKNQNLIYEEYKFPKRTKNIIINIGDKRYKIPNKHYPYIYLGVIDENLKIAVAYTYYRPRFID